jgi:phosphatidylserine/phosphatidylglycerophosphate/cardiolipin synthase-like enzyme
MPSRTEVLVTGASWAGGGRRSIETGLRDLGSSARTELLGTIYSIAEFPESVIEMLGMSLGNGVTTRLLIEDYGRQYVRPRRRLEALRLAGAPLWIYSFDDAKSELHAKLWVADRRRYLVGSANLSRRGFRSSHELAVLGDDLRTAESIGAAFDDLLRSPSVSLIHRPGGSS